MARPVTLFTGQWADLPLEVLAEKAASWGYDGLELACWGDHMDVFKAAEDLDYCAKQKAILAKHNLQLVAISNHLAGQLVCDPNNDSRSDGFAPADCAGNAEKKRAWAVEAVKNTARAAKNLGLKVAPGFTGSSIWHMLYSFPPVPDSTIDEGFAYFAEMFKPHPRRVRRVRREVRPGGPPDGDRFRHLHHKARHRGDRWTQGVRVQFRPQPLALATGRPGDVPARIQRPHLSRAHERRRSATRRQVGYFGLSPELRPPQPRLGFRSLGHGGVDFEEIIRTLNHIGYQGPLSIEWEDSGMNREAGAKEACEFTKSVDFEPSDRAFDAAFDE